MGEQGGELLVEPGLGREGARYLVSKGVVAVGADTYVSGGRTVGSVLLARMKVAGS